MEQGFWHERWAQGRIGFHQSMVNPWLQQYWSRLQCDSQAQVLVPLCGKSRDMLWLREQGHGVVGIELSDIACRDFFVEQGAEVTPVTVDNYHRRERDGIVLLCGDIFELPWQVFEQVGAVYDRAALIALPPPMRKRYAERLRQRLPSGCEMLLITLEYPGQDGPPFAVYENEVRRLFEPAFVVERLGGGEPATPRHEDEREVVYLLRRQ